MNGLQRQSDFQNGFRRQKSHSTDATCMGLSPRLPPRKQGSHNRSVSCDHDVPLHNLVKSRKCTNPPKDSRHELCLLSFACVVTIILACLGPRS